MAELIEKGMDINDTITPDEPKETAAETPKEEPAEQSTEGAELHEEEQEKLYAGKYKTPEELEKAYKNSNAEATRMAQRLAELESRPEPPEPPEQDETTQVLQSLPDDQLERIATENPDYAVQCMNILRKRDLARVQNMLSDREVTNVVEAKAEKIVADYPSLMDPHSEDAQMFRELVPPELGNSPKGIQIALDRFIDKKELMTLREQQSSIMKEAELKAQEKLNKKKSGRVPVVEPGTKPPQVNTPSPKNEKEVLRQLLNSGEARKWDFFE